ncbi:MAG: PepSY domain-containing protein, partial [Bacteroidota bacterium]
FYINPTNGKPLAEVSEQPPVYQLATSLHRSLMLGTFGRIIVGICSFSLLLITISGLFLIARKQGGWRKLLKRGVKENTFGYYHTELSKIVFIPLAILAVSGVFLSLDRFFELSHYEATHQSTKVPASEEKKANYSDFTILQETPISALRSLEFPFSSDPEDYFKLSLKEKELLVHQYSGEVSSSYHYPVMALLARTMFALHTGSLGSWWSILVGLTSLTIPFFIVSGFIINRQRSTVKVDNPFDDEAVEYVVVYGSESGSTQQFAMRFHTALLQAGLRSTFLEMNAYRTFSQIKHLIVFTATYGAGEAPANANAFRQIMQEIARRGMPQFQYTVLGFGSTAYASFCAFAKETDQFLSELPCIAAMELKTVNNNAARDFEMWLTSWQLTTDTQLEVDYTDLVKKKKTQSFEVLFRKESLNSNDETFLLGLSKGADQFQSGDLLAIYPPGETRERYYSVAKVKNSLSSNDVVLLSIKRHAHGKCSKFLSTLNTSDTIDGYMVSNSKFHLPSDAKKVVMISNGTGIAPFLGMLNGLDFGCEVSLYWGGQIPSSFALYQ